MAENDDSEAAEIKIGDHVATVLTQVPTNVNDEMISLASQLLEVERKIACSSEPGMSSRLEFDKNAPTYCASQETQTTKDQNSSSANANDSFWKKYF